LSDNQRQDQRSGDNSLNAQVGGDIVIYEGVTIDEVKTIAQLTVEANLYKMRGVAQEVFDSRVDKIRDDVITALSHEPEDTIEKGKDPDFQIALLDVQKSYGRTGDDDMGDLLVKMLIERTRKPERSLSHVVLGEALKAAESLPPSLYDVLSVIFILRYTQLLNIANIAQLSGSFAFRVAALVNAWPPSFPSLQHLEYAGCASIDLITSFNPIDLMMKNHEELFKNGLSKADFEKDLRAQHPTIGALLDTWEASAVKSVTLTSVGMAIGATNAQRKTGLAYPLDVWIN
jgi:hypothetical protein